MVQVISAMAHHGYLEQPGGEVMVDYIVQQCALPPEEVRTTTKTHLFLDLLDARLFSRCIS